MKPVPHVNRRRPKPTTAPLSYRLVDCAVLTGLSVSGIRNLIRDGQIRAVRRGRAILVPRIELERIAGVLS